jgi:hypothetical protein
MSRVVVKVESRGSMHVRICRRRGFRPGLVVPDHRSERSASSLRYPLPGVFELPGDQVGCARSVAARDALKASSNAFCRLPTADRRQQRLRGPTCGDPIGDNTDAAQGLPCTGGAGECERPRTIGPRPSVRDESERNFVDVGSGNSDRGDSGTHSAARPSLGGTEGDGHSLSGGGHQHGEGETRPPRSSDRLEGDATPRDSRGQTTPPAPPGWTVDLYA